MFEAGSSFSSVINERTLLDLLKKIQRQNSKFPLKKFKDECVFDGLKYGERINLIKKALIKYLPHSDKNQEKESLKILIKALPPEIDSQQAGQSFWDNFIMMPMAEFVTYLALKNPRKEKKELYFYLDHLKIMTKTLSSENAIRPILRIYPEWVLDYLIEKCIGDDNVHVRRWASEGIRPRLPLSGPLQNFKKDPLPILKILKLLRNDESDYVYRSVANCLNDISKDNPKVVTDFLEDWYKFEKNIDNAQLKRKIWVTKHALRTLIKKGNFRALQLIGVKQIDFIVSNFCFNKKVKKGQSLEFSFLLKNCDRKENKFVVDVVLGFKGVREGIKRGREKIFKVKLLKLKPSEEKLIQGKIFMGDLSTRKVVKGMQKFCVQINGQKQKNYEFEVI